MYLIHLLIFHFLDYKKQEGAIAPSIPPERLMYNICACWCYQFTKGMCLCSSFWTEHRAATEAR